MAKKKDNEYEAETIDTVPAPAPAKTAANVTEPDWAKEQERLADRIEQHGVTGKDARKIAARKIAARKAKFEHEGK